MQRQLGAAVELAFEDLRRESGGRVLLQALAQLRHARRGQREADGVRVSAEADEDVVAAFERFEQMEAGDGAAGAVGLTVFMTQNECGAACALDHTRGEDAEDAAMPSFAVDDEAALLVDRARSKHGIELDFDLVEHGLFGSAAIGVELIEFLRELAGTVDVACGEELDDIGGNIHPASRIDAWADAEAYVSGSEGPTRRVELRDVEESAEAGVHRAAQA